MIALWIGICLGLLVFGLLFLVFCYYHPTQVVSWWNARLAPTVTLQDQNCHNGIVSYQNAWEVNHETVVDFHRLLYLNHEDILAEIANVESLTTLAVQSAKDLEPVPWLKDESGWNPIWIRRLGEWTETTDRFPTLKRIVALFPTIPNLYLSVFLPGTTLIEHQTPHQAFYRYHYGIRVPEDDVGMKLDGFAIRWRDREGYVWNDTLTHSVWNHTEKERIVIMADILRDLSLINRTTSHAAYNLIKYRTARSTQHAARSTGQKINSTK